MADILFMNCANLRFGGAKTVGLNILHYFKNNWVDAQHKMIIVAPENSGYEQFLGDNVVLELIPQKYHLPFLKPLLNYAKLPNLAKKYAPDFIFSLGNIAFKSPYTQMVLIHIPYPVYPESPVWKNLSLKYSFYLRSMVKMITTNLKYAGFVFVQTATMKRRLHQHLNIPFESIYTMPNSVSFTSLVSVAPMDFSKKEKSLLLLSKLYPHKNFDILIPVAEEIKRRNLPVSISVTLSKSDNKESAVFLAEVEIKGLSNIIKNAGHINFDKIAMVYESHDGLFLPTLLESFSGTYVEAMHFGRPIFTSKMDFAEEVCKDVAYYFNPINAVEIVNTIEAAFKDEKEMERRIEKGKEYATEFKSWDEIGDELKKFATSHIKTNSLATA